MAEAAVNLPDQSFSPSYSGEILRQQKTEASRQINNQRINTQITNSGIDSRLMSRQNSNNQPQSPTESNKPSQVKNEGTATQDAADSLKQAQQLAKLAANPTVAGVAVAAGEMAIDAIKKGEGGKMITGHLLKTWWFNLLNSFGLTLLPLNIQAWVGFIEGHKFFCKLGEEWKAPGIFKKAISWLEIAGLLTIDLVAFLLILTVVAFIIFIINVMTHPLENIKILWDLFGGALDSLL